VAKSKKRAESSELPVEEKKRGRRKAETSPAPTVEVRCERCAGIDVHKEQITVCLVVGDRKEIREYGTMTGDILECMDWLLEEGCEVALMESTSSYWKPIYNLFEASEIKIKVANAFSVKQISGRRTDVQSSEWLATLVRFDLVKTSYIPKRDQRELRELVRYRNSLVQHRASEVNRIHKVLEGANIKLSSVVSDMQGVTAISILRLMATGEVDPVILSLEAKGSLRSKVPQLQKALQGSIGQHQQKMLFLQLEHYDHLCGLIMELDEEIKKKLKSEDEVIDRLCAMPGVARRSAERILAETGTDMAHFPSADHLASWAGLAPGANESAGVKKKAPTLPGNTHLRSILIECAWAATKAKQNFYRSRYWRLAPRCGKKRAATGVARSMLVTIYHMLKNNTPYVELGADYFTRMDAEKIAKRSLRNLESLGYMVSVTPPQPVAG